MIVSMKLATGTQIAFARLRLQKSLVEFGKLTGVSDKTIKLIEKSGDSICDKVKKTTLADVTEKAESALISVGWHFEPEGGISPMTEDANTDGSGEILKMEAPPESRPLRRSDE